VGGVGISPVGLFPAGFALPETAADPPDGPDQARYLDYLLRDYVLRSDGELERMPITRQRVLLALSTLLESSTVQPEFGVRLPGIIDQQDEAAVRSAVRVALRHLTSDGSVLLKAVTVNSSDVIGRSQITVEYEDTSTLDSDKVEI